MYDYCEPMIVQLRSRLTVTLLAIGIYRICLWNYDVLGKLCQDLFVYTVKVRLIGFLLAKQHVTILNNITIYLVC